MTRGRAIAAIAAAFIVSQILAVTVHGFLLAADYAPFDGTLLRAGADGTPPWQMLFLPLVHLSGIVTLVWVYGRLRLTGSTWARGLVLGLELVSAIAIGLTVACVAPASAVAERRAV